MEIQKRTRIKDKKMIAMMRKPHCERCRSRAYGEPHHIFTRGSGGGDIRENLIQLCIDCHIGAHDSRVGQRELIDIVAQREGKTSDEIVKINRTAQGRDVE